MSKSLVVGVASDCKLDGSSVELSSPNQDKGLPLGVTTLVAASPGRPDAETGEPASIFIGKPVLIVVASSCDDCSCDK
jgi:hypothetical protein